MRSSQPNTTSGGAPHRIVIKEHSDAIALLTADGMPLPNENAVEAVEHFVEEKRPLESIEYEQPGSLPVEPLQTSQDRNGASPEIENDFPLDQQYEAAALVKAWEMRDPRDR